MASILLSASTSLCMGSDSNYLCDEKKIIQIQWTTTVSGEGVFNFNLKPKQTDISVLLLHKNGHANLGCPGADFSWIWQVCSHQCQSLFNTYLTAMKFQCRGLIQYKMVPSYPYRKSHCVDKTILWSSHLHEGISYMGKRTSIYLPNKSPGSGLNIKMSSYQNRDSPVKDKTVSRPSYL